MDRAYKISAPMEFTSHWEKQKIKTKTKNSIDKHVEC